MLTAIFGLLLAAPQSEEPPFLKEIGSASPEQIERLSSNYGRTFLSISPPDGFSLQFLASQLTLTNWPMAYPAYLVHSFSFPGPTYRDVQFQLVMWEQRRLQAFQFKFEGIVNEVGEIPEDLLKQIQLPQPMSLGIPAYEDPLRQASVTTQFHRFTFKDIEGNGDIWHALYKFSYIHGARRTKEDDKSMPVHATITLSRVEWICDHFAPPISATEPYKFIPHLTTVFMHPPLKEKFSEPIRLTIKFDKGTTYDEALEYVGMSRQDLIASKGTPTSIVSQVLTGPISTAKFPYRFFSELEQREMERIRSYYLRWHKHQNGTSTLTLETMLDD